MSSIKSCRRKSFLPCLTLLLIFSSASAQTKFATDPTKAIIHTEDIPVFWNIFDETKPALDGDRFQKNYLDRGSAGLKGFIPMRIESGENLVRVILQDTGYYQKIRGSSLSISSKKDTLYQYFAGFKKIYPAAVFPDIYFVIGARNSGGTTFDGGLIIGAEMFGKEVEGFKPRLDINVVNQVVVHELIHFQQNYANDNSLLAQSIREGSADFLCELVTGGHSNKPFYVYGDAHEKDLWDEFQKTMFTDDWGTWLYTTKDKSRPADLGYWMGYKVVKAYYDKAANKSQAVVDILNIKDFRKFYAASGYGKL
ncbi:DUF2268 domain-containing putative Zn-dependent protease [Pollutibacter soli]|uniref:gliding motility protein GldB-related protein n=1 Tax=Pollutibacter soli TaxID=3034157 RepID=UPI003013ED6D